MAWTGREHTTRYLASTVFMKSRWFAGAGVGAGEDGREFGADDCDLGVLNVCDLLANPRPRPRELGVEGTGLAASRPRAGQHRSDSGHPCQAHLSPRWLFYFLTLFSLFLRAASVRDHRRWRRPHWCVIHLCLVRVLRELAWRIPGRYRDLEWSIRRMLDRLL